MITRDRLSRRILIVLFVSVMAFTGYHAVRLVSDAIYWKAHRDEPIERWMTIGYVAHSYHLPRHVLEQALDLQTKPDRRTLGQIAQANEQSMDEVRAKLNEAITHARPPYPPPGPPTKTASAKTSAR